MNKNRMNLRMFQNDVNIIDRTGAESLIPTQETKEIIQGTIAQSAVLSRGRKLANMTSKQYKMPVLDMLPIACKKKQEAGTVKSENNDGYSVSYAVEQADGQTMEELIRKKAYEAASTYLLPTGWLSRKVGCCHADECDDYNL